MTQLLRVCSFQSGINLKKQSELKEQRYTIRIKTLIKIDFWWFPISAGVLVVKGI